MNKVKLQTAIKGKHIIGFTNKNDKYLIIRAGAWDWSYLTCKYRHSSQWFLNPKNSLQEAVDCISDDFKIVKSFKLMADAIKWYMD